MDELEQFRRLGRAYSRAHEEGNERVKAQILDEYEAHWRSRATALAQEEARLIEMLQSASDRLEQEPVPPQDHVGHDQASSIAWHRLLAMDRAGWHRRYGGIVWRYDGTGLQTRDIEGKIQRWRTEGVPYTVKTILAQMGSQIAASSARHQVPPELLVMIIASESGRFANEFFTGPATFRWEGGGRYSAGPVQMLAATARELNSEFALGYDGVSKLPTFTRRPETAPVWLALYDIEISIELAAIYVSKHAAQTGLDPILVAAAYNAGGIYSQANNRWHIRSYHNHLDRAAAWFGDAAFILSEYRRFSRVLAR